MKKLFFMALLCLLGSCATKDRYDTYIESFVGLSEQDLIKKNGIPDGSYDQNGIRYIIYNKSTVNSFNGLSSTLSCKTVFEIKNGYVNKSSHKGNHCVK